MAKKVSDETYSFACAINSFVSTYISGLVHPLDVIKTRFQSHDGKAQTENLVPQYKGIVDGLKTIYNQEGFKGLYKGFHVSIMSQALATALFFWIYEYQKLKYRRNGYQQMNAVALASTEASLFGTLITQPLWVIKTRMLLNTKSNVTDMQNFMFSCRQIVKQHGLYGYARGLGVSLVLSISGIAQICFYQAFKKGYQALEIPQSRASEIHFICGGLSKLLTVIVSYPLTTIRTRMQQNQYIKDENTKKYQGNIEIILKTYKDEGFLGFYKGFKANLVKGIIQKGLYFYFYQLFKVMISKTRGQANFTSVQ